MIGEGFSAAFARFKSTRDILWLGHRDQVPPASLGPSLSRVQFALLESVERYLPRKPLSTVLLSPPANFQVSASLFKALESVPANVQKILVVPAEMKSLDENYIQLVNRVHFQQILHSSSDEDLSRDVQMSLASGGDSEAGKDSILSKKELELRVSRVRALVNFLKELGGIKSVEELLEVLRSEVHLMPQVKEPIMVYQTRARSTKLMYFQGANVLSRVINHAWPETILPRINDKKDSQFLADQFSRPFARVIAIPLSIHRTGGDYEQITPGVLYFEHSLSESNRAEFINFIHERLHPIAVALDRLFLEKDLTESSLLWESTFDGLADPIAIFDGEGKVLRANKLFQKYLQHLDEGELMNSQLRVGDRTYEVHKYPILAGQEKSTYNQVVHYVDTSFARQLKRQMVQQEKMAALGHLAGNIAHELNNPLTGIRSLSQVLLKQVPESDRRHGDLQEVELAAERCQLIISNLLSFASGTGQKEWVSLNDVAQKTLPLLKTLIRNFEVDLDLTKDDVSVFVEPQLLQQVAFNLIKNACQAMGAEGKLKISTQAMSQNGVPYCEFSVQDTGPGISAEVQAHIFDVFYTTKQTGQGTGLGLSLSKSIVDRFGGEIFLESAEGVGSSFKVRLPKKQESKT